MAIEELLGHQEVDWLGNTYMVGDKVLYPRMSGRSVEMALGTVDSFYRGSRDYGDDEIKVRIRVEKGSRFTDWNGDKGNPHDRPPVTIGIIENITKLN